MTQDEFNQLAWRDFLIYSFGEPECRAAFTKATGMLLDPALRVSDARTPIEKLIDNASGASHATYLAFVDFVTVNYWGLEHAPKSWVADYSRRQQDKAGSP